MAAGTIKITINSANALTLGAQVIADVTEVIQRMPMGGGPVVQESQLAAPFGQASGTQFRAQVGNYAIQRRFKITKLWPDNKQSNDFYETAVATYAGVADVYVSHTDWHGVVTTYLYPQAKVELIVEEPIGVCTVTNLTITGGPAVLQP